MRNCSGQVDCLLPVKICSLLTCLCLDPFPPAQRVVSDNVAARILSEAKYDTSQSIKQAGIILHRCQSPQQSRAACGQRHMSFNRRPSKPPRMYM